MEEEGESYLEDVECPRILPEFVTCKIKSSFKSGPFPIEEEPYSEISVFADGVVNDSPHPQVRNSMQFFRKNDVPYLFYYFQGVIYKINLENNNNINDDENTTTKKEVEKVCEGIDFPFFYLSKYSNKIFDLFTYNLTAYDLETKEMLYEPVRCHGDGRFNCITMTRDEKRIFSVNQTDYLCLYDLNDEEKKIKLLWTYDLEDYGNQITISKDEKWISLVTDDLGGFIFRYYREKDDDEHQVKKVVNNLEYLRRYMSHFEESLQMIKLSGQSNFCDFNCNSTRCVICTGQNLSIFRLIDNDDDDPSKTVYLEVVVNISKYEDEEELPVVFFGGTSSLAKYSPTNPDILVFTKSTISGEQYDSDHRVYIFKHGGGGGGKNNNNNEKGQILRCLDLPSYEHHFGTIPLLERTPEPVIIDAEAEGEQQIEEEDDVYNTYNPDPFREDDRNFHIFSCSFHDNGRSIYISLNLQRKKTSQFLKVDLKKEFWGSKSGCIEDELMHKKDLRERIEFLNYNFGGDEKNEESKEYFKESKKKKIVWGLRKNVVVVYLVFLLM